MQTGGAEPPVELVGVEFDIVEVVRETLLADEIVDRFDREVRRLVSVS